MRSLIKKHSATVQPNMIAPAEKTSVQCTNEYIKSKQNTLPDLNLQVKSWWLYFVFFLRYCFMITKPQAGYQHLYILHGVPRNVLIYVASFELWCGSWKPHPGQEYQHNKGIWLCNRNATKQHSFVLYCPTFILNRRKYFVFMRQKKTQKNKQMLASTLRWSNNELFQYNIWVAFKWSTTPYL